MARLKARSAAAPKACDASDFDQLPGQIGIDATSHPAILQAARREALTAATRLVRQYVGPDAVRWAADDAPHHHDVADEVKRLADQWPEEFRLGYRFGFRGKADPPCDQAGYPSGFHAWPLASRNAWFCGFNRGRIAIDKVTVHAGGGDG